MANMNEWKFGRRPKVMSVGTKVKIAAVCGAIGGLLLEHGGGYVVQKYRDMPTLPPLKSEIIPGTNCYLVKAGTYHKFGRLFSYMGGDLTAFASPTQVRNANCPADVQANTQAFWDKENATRPQPHVTESAKPQR